MYDDRFNGYMYTDTVNYNELNVPEESYKIKGFSKLTSDSLRLTISPTPQKTNWTITDSDNKAYSIKSTEMPTIKLKTGLNTYTVTSDIKHQKLNSNIFTIEYLPNDNYTFLVNSTLPLIEYSLFPLNRWTKLSSSISQNEIQETKKIIAENIKLNDSLPTTEKIKLISLYLESQLKPAGGSPFGNMKQETPLTQFKLACAKQNEVDCAVYANVFHLFANCAGIPTRKIGVLGNVDHIVTSGHVFNECYIKEQCKWAFVDLTSKKVMVLNSNNDVLNSADILSFINSNNYEGKSALVINPFLKIDTVKYSSVNQSEIDYLKPTVSLLVIKDNINENMNFRELFNEYLGETSHYGVSYINTIKVDNSKHYYKLFIYKLSIILFGFWSLLMSIRIFIFLKERLITK